MKRLSEAQAKLASSLVTEAKNKANLSNEGIAGKAGYNERVVRDVIHARCRTPETVRNVCTAVGIDFDAALAQAGLSDDDDGSLSNSFGGYSKSNYGHLIGSYTTIRCAYLNVSLIRCYRTKIDWDPGFSALRFSESDRDDTYGLDGHVYIPPSSAFMYLVSIRNGFVRTALVSQLSITASTMRGLILSQYNSSGPHYAPVCSPIVYIKQEKEGEVPYGEVRTGNPKYEEYRTLLEETISRGFVKIAVPQTSAGELLVIPKASTASKTRISAERR